VTLFFRVANVYRNAKINIYKDGKLCLSSKKTKLAPGEMESLLLKTDVIRGAKNLSIKLEEAE